MAYFKILFLIFQILIEIFVTLRAYQVLKNECRLNEHVTSVHTRDKGTELVTAVCSFGELAY